MHSRSYGAIGVAEICERAGVRKGSFYHFFDSKQALTVAALRATWAAERIRWVETLDLDPGVSGLERLMAQQVDSQRDAQRIGGSVTGCLYGNLALETGAEEPALRDCLREIFDDQTEMVRGSLITAASTGDIPRERATPATARAVIAQLEGAVLFAKLYDDPATLDDLWPQLSGLLTASGLETHSSAGARTD